MEGVWATWWVWLAFALTLGIMELLLPGFIFLGFSIGALAVTLLLLLNGGLVSGVPPILLVFAVLSLAAWLALRRIFGTRKGQVKTFDRDIND